jgi:hypothetical protein
MRAMADIQAEGLRAAGDLIERMLGSEPEPRPPRARTAPGGEYAALVDAWVDLLRRSATALARPAEPGPLTVELDGDGASSPLRLHLTHGSPGAVELWLRNAGLSEVGPLALRCGPLADPEGRTLDGAVVRFEPADLGVMPARSSRGVTVSLAPANGSLRPGTYRGAIQAQGAPALWVPLEVAVLP